jgi:outer membrane protein assembly factor BamB
MEPLLPADPPEIGEYRLVARLGAGGMGRVYLGRSAGGLPVAVKVIHERFARDDGFRARFVREVATARAVSGAFTAPVIDADPEATTPWLVTGYVPGVSLQDAVARHGPFPAPAAYALGAGLAEALVSVHQAGVVHRDLKPSNVLLSPDGPRVIDFGIARAADLGSLTAAGAVIGSPGYMSPEQASGREVGPAGDVFAFGAVLAFTVTGRGPFGTGSAAVLTYRVIHTEPLLDAITDPFLGSLVAECLSKDPGLRPEPARLLERLAPLAGPPRGTTWLPGPVASAIGARATVPAGVAATPAPPMARTQPPPAGTSRRRFAVLGAVGGVVLAVGGTGVAIALREAFSGGRQLPPTEVKGTPGRPDAPPVAAKVLWRSRLDLDYGAPAIAGGMVLFPEGDVVALDVRNGKRLWRSSTDGSISRCASALHNGLMYGCAQDGVLYALDTRNQGELRWSQKVASSFLTRPAVAGDVVYVLGDMTDQDGTRIRRLATFDARTGKAGWRQDFPAGGPFNAEFAVGDGLVVVAERALQAFDAASGKSRWAHAMSDPGQPAIAGGIVYAVGSGALHALRDGNPVWTNQGQRLSRQRVVLGSGLAYVAGGNGTVLAVDVATGRARWQVTSEGQQLLGLSGGLVHHMAGRRILALDAASGQTRWTYDIEGNSSFTPVVADGVAYAGVSVGGVGTSLMAIAPPRPTPSKTG